ncbi:MAG: tRNA (adenosine(37)-N6)-threonylcarbamoyltransferase complex dimerization subunit type 1 TsaB [Phycisphaerales bacterium]
MTESVRTILAIEASNPSSGVGGVCVARVSADGSVMVLGSSALKEGTRSSDGVMESVDQACVQAGLAPRDLDVIAVSAGPGGYTALRIATTTTKVLAHATRSQVVAVPTARVAAIAIQPEHQPSLIALAGKNSAAHITLLRADGSMEALGVVGADAIEPEMAKTLVGDDFVPAEISQRCAKLGMARIKIELSGEACLRASLGISTIEPDALEPAYAREPDAVTQWRARNP